MPELGCRPSHRICGPAWPRRLASVAIIGLLAGACSFDSGAGHASGAIPTLPTPVHASTGLPATPLPNGQFRGRADSGPVEHGRVYRYELYTHCGLARSHVDVDGSFWEPVEAGPDGNPPAGFGNPTDIGTIVISAADPGHLTYTSARGIEATFRRAAQTIDFVPCA